MPSGPHPSGFIDDRAFVYSIQPDVRLSHMGRDRRLFCVGHRDPASVLPSREEEGLLPDER